MDNADLIPILIFTLLLVVLSWVLLMGNYFTGLGEQGGEEEEHDDDVWIRQGLNPSLTPPLNVPRSENVGLEPITKNNHTLNN